MEDAADFLNSGAWTAIVGKVREEVRQSRNMLLTSPTLPEYMRISSIARLGAYRQMFEFLYEQAGSKLPGLFLELFTGSDKA